MDKESVFSIGRNGNGKCIYCYKSENTSRKILSSMKIKFCSIGSFNDPLENTLQHFFIDEDLKVKNLEKKRLLNILKKNLSEYYNENCRALCFTQDKPMSDETMISQAHRGYMRFRMWSQYADNGKGICFILDKEKADNAFKKLMIQKDIFYCNDSVKYSDNYGDSKVFSFKISDLLAMNKGTDIISSKIKKYYKNYFFTKRIDWSEENEYRYFAFTDKELFLDISNLLVGIVLGYYSSKKIKDFACEKLSSKKIPICKIFLQGCHAYIRGVI